MALSKKYSGITGLDADDVFSFAFEDNKFVGYFKDSDGKNSQNSNNSGISGGVKAKALPDGKKTFEGLGDMNFKDSVRAHSDHSELFDELENPRDSVLKHPRELNAS